MSGKICVESRSPAQTELIGEKLAAQLSGGEVIALYGGLGMGKTNFVRGLARGLGVEEGVSSPTFALVNEYHGRLTLYHFDMYRVTTWEDLYSTGFSIIWIPAPCWARWGGQPWRRAAWSPTSTWNYWRTGSR